MNENKEKIYRISFIETAHKSNWKSLSTITKSELMGFIKYLYSLNRKINVFPYIPGAFWGGPHKDKTYLVEKMAKHIKNKTDIDKMLNTINGGQVVYNCIRKIHFTEDVYEFYLSLGIDAKSAQEAVECQFNKEEIERYLLPLANKTRLKFFANWVGNDNLVDPYFSRWVFIYMFRNEFKKYMHDKGYKVIVDGGWVLNDKKREMALGLIDENGELY